LDPDYNPYRFIDPDGRTACGKDTTCALDQGAYGGSIQVASVSSSRESGSRRGPDASAGGRDQQGSEAARPARTGDRTVDLPRIISVAYRGYYHDELVDNLVQDMASKGLNVLKEVALCLGATCSRIDIMGRNPMGDTFAIEVKTGAAPKFTPNQLVVYPHLRQGGIVSSPDAKVNQLGLVRGAPLPPVDSALLYQFDASSPPHYAPIP